MTDKGDDYDYESLVERAKSKLPEEISKHERFVVPRADVLVEGKTTVLRNFGEIVGVLNRDPGDVYQYLLREMGTAGTLQGQRIVFKKRISGEQIDDKLREYVEEYVLCAECGRPDTRLEKEGRVLMLACDACGAKRPIKARKASKARDTEGRLK
ncbi:MAG: translation initiation factor IF-2 subunit beta, partial [Thermoplasmata archaeon]|nr:translation initiation factor IF-2 subunit beta [Thermoplasmata archaeon]